MKYGVLITAMTGMLILSACSFKTSEVKCDKGASGVACEQPAIKKDLPPMPGAKPINYENPTITSATVQKGASTGTSSSAK